MKPDAPQEQIENALELLRRLGRELNIAESWCVGRDFGGEFTVGALYVVKDIRAYEVYMNAPLHLQVDRAGLPLVSYMISQDLTIAEVHRNRYAGHPDLLDLIKDLGSYEGSGVAEEKAPSV
jgi:stress responsive alpha/beta barrel protein